MRIASLLHFGKIKNFHYLTRTTFSLAVKSCNQQRYVLFIMSNMLSKLCAFHGGEDGLLHNY